MPTLAMLQLLQDIQHFDHVLEIHLVRPFDHEFGIGVSSFDGGQLFFDFVVRHRFIIQEHLAIIFHLDAVDLRFGRGGILSEADCPMAASFPGC